MPETPANIGEALEILGLGDADFGAKCRPHIHRTMIWEYRTGRKHPRAKTVQNLIATFKRLGVTMTLDTILARSRKKHAA